LGFEALETKNLGEVFNMGDYEIKLTNRKVIDLQVCSGSGVSVCATKIDKKAIEYVIEFTGEAIQGAGVTNFVESRLGKNFLDLRDASGTSFPMQDIGGFPNKVVRFLVDVADKDDLIVFQSQQMKDANTPAVAWKSR